MSDFLSILISAVALGSTYALLALGYTLVYGVLKFINFAHSDVFVLGAWTSFTASTVILARTGYTAEQAPLWVAIMVFLMAIAVCSTVAYCIERFAYRPLRRAPRLNVLITAIGVSLLMQNAGQLKGFTVAREPTVVVDAAPGEPAAAAELGRPLATVPFGSSPRSMPSLLPDKLLNQSTVASGTLSGGSRRGQIKMDVPVTLEEGRTHRVGLIRQGTSALAGDTDSLTITSPAGTYQPGDELATLPKRAPADVQGAAFTLTRDAPVGIRLIDVIIVVSAILLMIGLEILVYRSTLGTAMRAISYNVETAQLMGINVNAVISFTFVLGAALAAAAGFLYPMKYTGLNQPAHQIWVLLGLKAFVAAVVGGIGNIRGAVLGGFIIAGVELFGARYISTKLTDVFVFSMLIIVLLVRPSGLLGTVTREKV